MADIIWFDDKESLTRSQTVAVPKTPLQQSDSDKQQEKEADNRKRSNSLEESKATAQGLRPRSLSQTLDNKSIANLQKMIENKEQQQESLTRSQTMEVPKRQENEEEGEEEGEEEAEKKAKGSLTQMK